MSTKVHYVGRVVVEAIEVTEHPDSSGYSSRDATRASKTRSKHTVATITLASENLETLVQRVSQHLALVEDGGDVDG